MIKKRSLVGKLFGLLVIIFIIINFVPTKQFIMAPGIAQELSPIITVENGHKTESRGAFMLTAVSSQQATIWDLLYIKTKKPKGIEMESLEKHLPQGIGMKEYLQIMDKYMIDSQQKAQAVAFKKAGFEIQIEEKGVIIDEVLENGSAIGKLEKGDLIIAVDDKKVSTDQDAVNFIRDHDIGEEVKITVMRNDEKKDFNLETIELDNNPDKASIGVMIFTDVSYKFPRQVTFKTGNIAGPSAGGLFTLEIYNQLTPDDLTKGRRIAGTGTIDLDGKIGRIDGIQQKIMAALKNDADIFLVPEENYDEISDYEDKITLVKIKTIDDAINYLKNN